MKNSVNPYFRNQLSWIFTIFKKWYEIKKNHVYDMLIRPYIANAPHNCRHIFKGVCMCQGDGGGGGGYPKEVSRMGQ